MRNALAQTVLVLSLLALAAAPAADAQVYQEYSATVDRAERAEPSGTERRAEERLIERKAEEISREAEERFKDLAGHVDTQLEALARTQMVGWGAFVAMVAAGFASLLLGWSLFEAFLTPFTSVWGLVTGGFLGFSTLQALRPEATEQAQLGALAVGAVVGLTVCFVAARKAKPVAALIVILSPFAILSCILFPVDATLGTVAFLIGLLASAAAMMWMTRMIIIATAVFGACSLIGAYGLLSYLLHAHAGFLKNSFTWLLEDPFFLLIVFAVVTYFGLHFQHASAQPSR